MKVLEDLNRCISTAERREKSSRDTMDQINYAREGNQFKRIKTKILEDTALQPLMGVYNHICELEKKLNEANEKIKRLETSLRLRETYLSEYRDEFGISTAEKEREKKEREFDRECVQMAYQELCELGAFDDEI